MPVVSDYTALLGNGFGTWNLGTGKAVFVSYSFTDSAPPEYVNPYNLMSAEGAATIQPFTSAEKDIIRTALDVWAAASGIHFIEVAGQDGDIRFGKYNMSIDFGTFVGYGTSAGRSFTSTSSSDTAYNGDVILDYSAVNMRVVLHEIGHVIGLKHPFDGSTTLAPSLDTAANTVMGYSDVGFTNGLGTFDVQATNYLYGAQGGESGLAWSWDAVTSTLTQTGSGVVAGMGNANDVIFGSGGADTLLGWGGNDTLHITSGQNDKAYGGAGDDTFVVHGTSSGVFATSGLSIAVQGESGIDIIDYSELTLTDTLAPSQDRVIDFNLNANGIEGLVGTSDGDWLRVHYDPTNLGARVYVEGGPGSDLIDLTSAVATIIVRPGGGADSLYNADFRNLPYYTSPNRTVIDLSEMPGIDSMSDLLARWTLVPRYGDGVLVYGFDFGSGTTLEISGFSSDADDRVAFATSSTPRYFSPSNFIFSSLFTESNDTRVLSEANKTWFAKGGHDNVTGSSGADTIYGQAGNDSLDGGAGADALYGGDNEDTIDYDAADVVISGGQGTDTLRIINAPAPTSFGLAAHELERAVVYTDDTTGQWWQEIADTYNASWQRTNSDTLADNGNSVQTTFDVSAGGTGVNWQYISDYRNAFGTLTNQDGKFDNGGTFAKSYDYVAGTGVDGISDELREYTYFFRNVTEQAQGKVLNVEGFYDDGRKFTQTNDIDANQAWTFQTDWYETDGTTLDFKEVRWDDGSTQIIPY